MAEPISGTAQIIDGDSLKVGAREVRLFGIDAPELQQHCERGGQKWACGAQAAQQLSTLVGGKLVRCIAVGTDRYGRALGQCTAGPIDINRTMVAVGYALAFRRYSMTYVSAEESAKVSRRGIWAGTFELPEELRHSAEAGRLKPSQPVERPVIVTGSKPRPEGNCRIKGNKSRRGTLIYHLPGMPYYEQTVAEEIFCTERDAKAAGYRRSKADQHQ